MEPLFVCIANVAIVGIFAKVAIEFGKWWIVLFSLFALASYKADVTAKRGTDESGNGEDADG